MINHGCLQHMCIPWMDVEPGVAELDQFCMEVICIKHGNMAISGQCYYLRAVGRGPVATWFRRAGDCPGGIQHLPSPNPSEAPPSPPSSLSVSVQRLQLLKLPPASLPAPPLQSPRVLSHTKSERGLTSAF
ncbi:hypothetical protein CIB48_g10080 [Xylaria polymorpha]|nr:hypothetical protein CIB48_g10080 [Xylaria polymorpha]